ncbi:hypothetical protein RFI_05393, partial [Reticulomyxa filosa]
IARHGYIPELSFRFIKAIYQENEEKKTSFYKEINQGKENEIKNDIQKSESKKVISSSILKFEDLPEEWKTINIHLLEEWQFKEHHLVGLYKLNVLPASVVKESIEHFAYGIKHNKEHYKKYNDPLKVLIGTLRKGEMWIESSYKSKQELATLELMRRKREEKKKISIELCRIVDTMEAGNYWQWYRGLKEEDKDEIRKKYKMAGEYDDIREDVFKLHYMEKAMEENKSVDEIAFEVYLEKKKAREEEEEERLSNRMKEEGLLEKYYKWVDGLSETKIREFAEEEEVGYGKMTKRADRKLKLYYLKYELKVI